MNPNKQIKSFNEMGKLPPQAADLEDAVIGGVMLEVDAYNEIADIFSPDVFYKTQNNLIAKAIIDLKNDNQAVDILTVTQKLRANGDLEMVGGSYYVSSLTNRIASSYNIKSHMLIIMQMYVKRCAIAASVKLIESAYEPSSDIEDIVEEYEKNLTAITSKLFVNKSSDVNSLLKKVMDENFERINNPKSLVGISTGFEDQDNLLHGWQKSDLIILAARPSMGKTAKAIQYATSCALSGKAVGFISLEQSEIPIFKRAISQISQIPLENFNHTGLDDNKINILYREIADFRKSKFLINDTGGLTLFDIKNIGRKWKRDFNIQLLVIDYLQLIDTKNSNHREQDVSAISRGLKSLAKELDIPVIALSQLSRKCEDRPDKIPKLSDLRDSGAIEQDADIVEFIYRPEYYGMLIDGNNNSTRGLAKSIIAKNRNGSLGDIDLRFDGTCTRFSNFNQSPKNDFTNRNIDVKSLQANDDFLQAGVV